MSQAFLPGAPCLAADARLNRRDRGPGASIPSFAGRLSQRARFRLAWPVGLCMLVATGGAIAQAPISSPDTAGLPEASLASTRQFDMQSAINGEQYRIQVWIPHGAAPPGGFPVLYLLDGNAVFGTFANAERNRSQAGELSPAVVVGISSGEGGHGADRMLDFTSAQATMQERAIVKDLGANPRLGGAEAFFQVIQTEIRPRIDQIVPVNENRAILFGWSLGGLFVVHTLLAHPESFSTFLALSPSLWEGGRAAFNDIPAFESRVARQRLRLKVYIGVGGRETDINVASKFGMSDQEFAAEIKYIDMIRNVQTLGRTLRHFLGRRQSTVAVSVFNGETHNSVPWVAVNPFLTFALGK